MLLRVDDLTRTGDRFRLYRITESQPVPPGYTSAVFAQISLQPRSPFDPTPSLTHLSVPPAHAHMDAREEQEAELEALEAIFMDDFSVSDVATSARGARFSISLTPEGAPGVEVRMDFEHSLGYPDDALIATALALAGLSGPRRTALLKRVDQMVADGVGGPCVFGVCEGVKEWLCEGDEEEDDEEEGGAFETRDVTTAAKVEVIASKAIGTPVTVESFRDWRERFEKEMEGRKTAEERRREAVVKPSGRELFELNKATVAVSGESESFWEAEADEFAE